MLFQTSILFLSPSISIHPNFLLVYLMSNNSLRFCELQNQKIAVLFTTLNCKRSCVSAEIFNSDVWIFYAHTPTISLA